MKKSILVLSVMLIVLIMTACNPTQKPGDVSHPTDVVLDEGGMTDPNFVEPTTADPIFTEPTPVDPSAIDLTTMDGKIDYAYARIKQFNADNNLSDADFYAFSNDGETLAYQIFLRQESALKTKLDQFVQDYEANGSLSDQDQGELEDLMAIFKELYTEIEAETESSVFFQLMRYDGFVYLQIKDGLGTYSAFQQ